jgi:hypothetical protein
MSGGLRAAAPPIRLRAAVRPRRLAAPAAVFASTAPLRRPQRDRKSFTGHRTALHDTRNPLDLTLGAVRHMRRHEAVDLCWER